MKILIISLGHSLTTLGVNISGGDIRWIEIAKSWNESGNEIHIFTTRSGRDLCKKMKLDFSIHVLDEHETKSNILKYFFIALKSAFVLPQELIDLKPDLVYSASTEYYDLAPAIQIKRKCGSSWVSVVHWIAPLRRHGKIVSSLFYYIQQRAGLMLIRTYADKILAVSPSTRDQLLGLGLSSSRVDAVDCGVDYYGTNNLIKKYEDLPKIYDAMFMKRFHSAKGVFDLIDIWDKVVKTKSDAKLILLGGGSEDIVTEMEDLIKAKGLSNNIKFVGLVYDFEEKIKIMLQSKLFILPTYEENWAIVIGEALTCGLPVICYELPEIKPIWNDTVYWIKKGDLEAFADKIIHLLNSPEERKATFDRVKTYTRRYDWPEVSKRELSLSLKK